MKRIFKRYLSLSFARGKAFFMPVCFPSAAVFGAEDKLIGIIGVIEKPHVWGLFKNVQMQGAQKIEPRGVYGYTLSGTVYSATQQMSVFQQPFRSRN
jgi:hypothetical protein